MPRKKAEKIVPIGKKIKKARTEKKVSLDNLANDTGFSEAHLKQIEAGKQTPAVGTLLQISRALKLDSSYFLREQETSLSSRVHEYTKRTDNYAYTTLTPGAENKHLKAFKVSVNARQAHKGVGYHHEGEEFVHVLQGNIEITVGEHVNKLAQGDSLHFNSGISHHMQNVGDMQAELIVVIYGP